MSILCYHAVEDGWPSPMAVRPVDFYEQAEWLARHRTVLPLDAVVEQLDRRGRPPRGVTTLTFDDGFASLHDHAWPVLRRLGLPATVFLVAETLTVAGRDVDWVDTPPAGRSLATLTRDQVLEMQEDGVDFQSHSWAHRDLTALEPAELVTDLRESRALLEELLGRPVTHLAYPRGRHDEHVRSAARLAGYSYAYALPETREQPGPFAVPRVGVHLGNSLRVVQAKDHPRYLGVRTSAAWKATGALRAVARV